MKTINDYKITNKRLLEIDALRAIAILLIVFSHIDGYLINNGLARAFDPYISVFGLSIFFFMSGYSLYYTNNNIKSFDNIISFYKKRVIRIIPLYWLAIIASVIVFGLLLFKTDDTVAYNFGMISLIVNLLGLQALLVGYNMPSMWFITAILIYYIVYPFIIYLSKNTKDIVITAMLSIPLLISLMIPFRGINFWIYLYYSIFIGGIIACRLNLFYSQEYEKYLALFSVLLLTSLLVEIKFFNAGDYYIHGISVTSVISIALFTIVRDIMALSFCAVLYWFARFFIVPLNTKLINVLSVIAYGSYATYLFHVMFFAVFRGIADRIISNGLYVDILVILIAYPATFYIGYLIQKLADNAMNRFRTATHNKNLNAN